MNNRSRSSGPRLLMKSWLALPDFVSELQRQDTSDTRNCQMSSAVTRRQKPTSYILATNFRRCWTPYIRAWSLWSASWTSTMRPDLILGGHAIADADYGARGPRRAVNAQIPMPRRQVIGMPTRQQRCSQQRYRPAIFVVTHAGKQSAVL